MTCFVLEHFSICNCRYILFPTSNRKRFIFSLRYGVKDLCTFPIPVHWCFNAFLLAIPLQKMIPVPSRLCGTADKHHGRNKLRDKICIQTLLDCFLPFFSLLAVIIRGTLDSPRQSLHLHWQVIPIFLLGVKYPRACNIYRCGQRMVNSAPDADRGKYLITKKQIQSHEIL